MTEFSFLGWAIPLRKVHVYRPGLPVQTQSASFQRPLARPEGGSHPECSMCRSHVLDEEEVGGWSLS